VSSLPDPSTVAWATQNAGATVAVSRSGRYSGEEKTGIVIGVQYDCVVVCIKHDCGHSNKLTITEASRFDIVSVIPEAELSKFCSSKLNCFYTYEIDIVGLRSGKKHVSAWPHLCDRCSGPALHMMNLIDCKNRCSPDRRF
jgi:hypothetical protein